MSSEDPPAQHPREREERPSEGSSSVSGSAESHDTSHDSVTVSAQNSESESPTDPEGDGHQHEVIASDRIETARGNEESSDSGNVGDDTADGDISIAQSASSRQSASSHRRVDSVPPKKYNVDEGAANGLAASLAATSLHSAIAEDDEEADISFSRHVDPTEPQLVHSVPARQRGVEAESLHAPTPIDKADLNFVDITLDAPEAEPSVADIATGSLHPLASSARTAEQIRRDSVSSHDVAALNSAPSASPKLANETAPAPTTLSAHIQLSPPLSPDPDSTSRSLDSPSASRSVEGRYRGRRSAASSRAASPTRSPSRSPSRRTSFVVSNAHSPRPEGNDPSLRPQVSESSAKVLLAADEDGNISVVSDIPLSPRTIPEALPRAQDHGPGSSSQSGSALGQGSSQGHPVAGRGATSLSEEVDAAEAAEAVEAAKDADSKADDSNDASLTVPPAGSTTTASPGLTDKADQVDTSKRRKSSFASNASNDPVESRTRMTTLPAKSKGEEIKHRADFERMMMAAKEFERKKREEDEERKRRRQDEQRQALGRWEKEILPSWSRARKDPELSKLWWQGAPPSIRGRVWALAIGNPLMLPRNLLEQTERKAAGSGGSAGGQMIPPRVQRQIEEDTERTLPSLKLFQSNGPLHEDLVRLCRAFVLVRMEQISELDGAGDADQAASRHQHASPLLDNVALPGASASGETGQDEATSQDAESEDIYARRGIDVYQPGTSSLAAVLLINMPINTAFIALLNLLHSKPWLKALYSLLPTKLAEGHLSPETKPRGQTGSAYAVAPKEREIRGFERVLETLLADQMPKVYANLLAHNVKLYRVVLRDWVSTLWTHWLDVDTVMRLWDVVLLDETDSVIYRVCLALVQTLEARLYVPDKDELESVLKGTNRAALAIWRRDKLASGQLDALVAKRQSTSSTPPTKSTDSLPDPPPQEGAAEVAIPARASSLANQHAAPPEAHAEQNVVPVDYIYEQYNVQEHHVFDTLDAQLPTWKQSTLQRLLDRELAE